MISKFKYISIVFLTGLSLSGAYAFESHKISGSSHKYTFSLEGGITDGDAEAERRVRCNRKSASGSVAAAQTPGRTLARAPSATAA